MPRSGALVTRAGNERRGKEARPSRATGAGSATRAPTRPTAVQAVVPRRRVVAALLAAALLLAGWSPALPGFARANPAGLGAAYPPAAQAEGTAVPLSHGSIPAILGGAVATIERTYGVDAPAPQESELPSRCQDLGLPGGVRCGVELRLERGTPLAAPDAGRVVVAGGTSSFPDAENPQAGELGIEFDDRTRVFFGFLSRIDVAIEQRVEHGAPLGVSGGPTLDDGLLYLEVQVPNAATASGFGTVDPLLVFAANGTIADILNGREAEIDQPFGPTDLALTNPELFAYCEDLGQPSGVHCGTDFALPRATPLFAPAAGEVLVAGGTPFYRDELNPAGGELVLTLADRTQVIFGHMAQIDVALGAAVQPRQQLGLTGTRSTVDGIHLEVRVPDPSIPFGFRAVDPVVYFSGYWDLQPPAIPTA